MAQTLRRGPVTGTAADRGRKRKPFLLDLYSTAVGKKYVMAITGIIWIGFVIVHMIGNLKVYLGLVEHDGGQAYEIDIYGEFLRELLVPLVPRTAFLWGLRILLIVALLLHVHAAYGLTVINRRARPMRYRSKRDYVAANFASRTMRWTGVIILLYLAFHLADLTWGAANSEFVRGDPYNNLVYSLQRPVVAAIYIVASIALAIHLYHGAWSMFQSLGINNPRINSAKRQFATAFAIVMLLGNISFPIAIQLGLVTTQCPHAPKNLSCAEAARLHELNTINR